MPSTSRSSSTEVNPPCSVRHWRIDAAVTGPTSGRVSSSDSVAVLRLTSVAGPETPPAVGTAAAAAPVGAATPTTTCSPSTSTLARLSPVRSTPGQAPPAALIASTTREPASRTAIRGWRTLPATSTVTVPGPAAGVAVDPPGTAGSFTGATAVPAETRAGAGAAARSGAGWAEPRTSHQQVTA